MDSGQWVVNKELFLSLDPLPSCAVHRCGDPHPTFLRNKSIARLLTIYRAGSAEGQIGKYTASEESSCGEDRNDSGESSDSPELPVFAESSGAAKREMTLMRGPIKKPARALQKLVRLYRPTLFCVVLRVDYLSLYASLP